MRIARSAVSFTVGDPAASSRFLATHFGFRETMAAEGFVALEHDDLPTGIVFLRQGLAWLPAGHTDPAVAGVIVSFVVADLDAEEA